MSEVSLSGQIKALRQSRKMTMAVMAERLGVTTSAIAAYENGSRNPSFDVLIKIARLFNVTVDNLLGNTDRDLIDVTDLKVEQRNSIQDLIKTHREYNKAMEKLWEKGFYVSNEPLEGELTIVSIEPLDEALKKNKNKKKE